MAKAKKAAVKKAAKKPAKRAPKPVSADVSEHPTDELTPKAKARQEAEPVLMDHKAAKKTVEGLAKSFAKLNETARKAGDTDNAIKYNGLRLTCEGMLRNLS